MKLSFILAAIVFASSFSWAHSKLRSLEISRTGESSVIKIGFSAPVEVAFSRFSLKAMSSDRAVMELQVREEAKRVTELKLSGPKLEAGLYTFNWTILSTDGHRQQESRQIEVK